MAISRQQRRAAARKSAKRLVAGAAIAFGAAIVPASAHAATFTVTSTSDSGAGTLRDAIASANATSGADTIDFTVSGTITLTTGDLVITESVTIDGPGSSSLTISGNDSSRIFAISDGSSGTTQNVTIDGVTLTAGFSASDGGAIFSTENLTITDAVLTDNVADSGGAIDQANASSLTLTNVTLSSNQAGQRGAIRCSNMSNVTLSNVRVSDNSATNFEGAGGFSNIGTLVIEDSTFENNTAPLVAGPILFQANLTVPATIRRTTISGNIADDWCGGIRLLSTTATIESSTISGNVATTGNGGGLYLYASSITLKNSTVVNNTAGANSGNIFLYDVGTSLTIENSIVANGSAAYNPDIEDVGTIMANYSLVEVPPPSMTGANNITGTDPQLGSLQDNGGTTKTLLPSGTSPAINAGDPSFAAPPSTDQRGYARVADTTIDMGAVEVQSILSLSSATYSANENGGTLTVTVNRTGGSAGAVSVNYATSNDTADLIDYDVASGTLNWADGDTAPKTFDVTITDDSVFEGNETFNITLSSPGGGATIGTSAAVATINDNETQPTISIADVSAFEGNSGTTAFTFEVMLSHPSVQTITVDYTTANGTASDASDYTAASGTVTFNPEVTSQNVVVQVNGDTASEADETFTVSLTSPSNATIADNTGTGTITADDAPFLVTNTNDSNAGSLRNAIASANAVAGADTITFGVTGTITLTSGELAITESVTIDGPGASSLTISGNNSSRIFNITDGTGTLQNVAVDGLTLTSGNAPSANGGAIRSLENLTISDSVLTGNSAIQGGALHHSLGSVTLSGVSLASNEADTCGGLCVEDSPTVTLSNVQITNNLGNDHAGGGFSHIDTLVIEDSTISGNLADNVAGLNFYYVGETASGIIRRTTISNNESSATRGAVFLKFSDLRIENSTISGNSAIDASGGALYLYGSVATLEHSTVSGNTAGTSGGNIFLYASTVTLENSIVANGSAPSGPDILVFDVFSGAIANYSLIETPPAGLTGANNLTGVDPQLGPLQNNGGLTQTQLPAGTSPAIDAGDPSFAAPPNTDQRGDAREANGTIDMGAVEVQSILSLSSATYSVDEDGGTLTVTVNRTGGSTGATSIDYATSHGTADGSDYVLAEGDLSWDDGDTAPKTFDVTITDDAVFEGDETFNITLDNPGQGATIGTVSAVATIVENEILAAPVVFSATPFSASQVNLAWSAVTGATSYEIFRATSITSGYSLLATTSNTSYDDLAVSADTAYLYKVRAKNGDHVSDLTSVDGATTIIFTDPTLGSAITAKAVHLTELRTAVNAMRAAAGLTASTFTDPTITAESTTIKDEHITELRTALDAARAAIGLSSLVYADPTITPQSTLLKAAHVAQLRAGTQ